MARTDWILPEALWWVLYGDPAAIGAEMDYGRSEILKDPAEVVVATALQTGRSAEAQEAEPWEALRLALIMGRAIARGTYELMGGFGQRVIPADEWPNLVFYRAYLRPAAFDEFASADNPTRCWYHRVRFDRASVIAAFPSKPGLVDEAWRPGPKERITEWCRSDRAEAAARARIKSDIGAPSEKAICRDLFKMWQEADRKNGSARSIETMRASR